MEQDAWKNRKCPACGSHDYSFRSRKKVAADAVQPEALETKYRCKTCQHEWRERVAVEAGD